MGNYSDLSFDVIPGENTSRSAFRVTTLGIYIHIRGLAKLFNVVDLSAIGFSFNANSADFKQNETIIVDIVIARRIMIKGLQAEIVRLLSDTVIACAFNGLSRHHEYELDKLVLEIQKRGISSFKFLK